MKNKVPLKQNFNLETSLKPIFTSLKLCKDFTEDYFVSYANGKINVSSIENGKIVLTLPNEDLLEEDEIINFSVNSLNKNLIVIAFKSGLIRLFEWNNTDFNLIKTWRSQHTGPIVYLTFDLNTGSLIATGGSDGIVIIWDVVGQYVTHFFKGCSGIISTINFEKNPTENHYYIAAAGNHDNTIHIWNLKTSSLVVKLEKHSSEITGCEFFVHDNKKMLISSSRDKIAVIWNLENFSSERTIPIYDSVSSLVLLPQDYEFKFIKYTVQMKAFVTVGEKGCIEFWEAKTGQKLFSKQIIKKNDNELNQSLLQIILNQKYNKLVAVTYENNILIYDLKDLNLSKQLCGNNDEILDLCLLGNENYVLVASNSTCLKIFNLLTSDCCIHKEHSDTIINVNKFLTDPYMFVSTSKDKTFKIWRFNQDKLKIKCLFTGIGHNLAVTSCGLPNLSLNWIATGSDDNTIKIWSLPKLENQMEDIDKKLVSQTTCKIHEKGVNYINISPNDKLIATSSNDKTGKIFKFDKESFNIVLLGTLHGHKRRIWCIVFSPTDQIVATSSADTTIKIWSLANFSCLKTFEGHQDSVLKVSFLTRGLQLLSSCSDGNLKIWSIKNFECLNTIDAHEDKIYCFVLNQNENRLITGGHDSEIKIWKDVTQELENKKLNEDLKLLEKNEVLNNLINNKNWEKAIRFSISLNKPFTTLNVLRELTYEFEDVKQKEILKKIFQNLREDQIVSILNYISIWNTNQKNCFISQLVLRIIFEILNVNTTKLSNIKELIQKIEPYTRKHYERYKKLYQNVTFFNFLYNNLKMSELELQD